METLENLNHNEIGDLLRKERLKHALDRVLETQEVLARFRVEHRQGDWESAKAKVTFTYYMNVLGEMLKEREAEILAD